VSRLEGHGIAIRLPRAWEGRIFLPDLAPPAVNLPVVHVTDRPLATPRSSFAPELAARAGAEGTLFALVEYEPALAGRGLYAAGPPTPPIPRDALHPAALQVPNPAQEGRQWFFSAAGRAFCLYLVVGIGRGLDARLAHVNEVLASLRIDERGAIA
jgi:hypothetical protein